MLELLGRDARPECGSTAFGDAGGPVVICTDSQLALAAL